MRTNLRQGFCTLHHYDCGLIVTEAKLCRWLQEDVLLRRTKPEKKPRQRRRLTRKEQEDWRLPRSRRSSTACLCKRPRQCRRTIAFRLPSQSLASLRDLPDCARGALEVGTGLILAGEDVSSVILEAHVLLHHSQDMVLQKARGSADVKFLIRWMEGHSVEGLACSTTS
jgi:hypothetical protein